MTAALADVVAPEGIGGDAALEVFKNVILPACRPNDDPLMVSYVPTAPTPAAVLFDMVVSASSIFAGHWEAGAGAIAAENQALRWIMDIADFPPEAGGVFVSGGTAANLSALVTARESWHASNPERGMGTRLELAAAAHSQHGDYLGYIERAESNPSDLALHLTRRARGLPLWFSLAANGTSAYAEAIDTTMDTASAVAESVRSIDGLELAVAPRLSVVLFRRTGWEEDDYVAWSERNAAAGTALIVPTRWDGEVCMRVCIVNPLTDAARLHEILLDMAAA